MYCKKVLKEDIYKTVLCLSIIIFLPLLFFYNGKFLENLIEGYEGLIYFFPSRVLTSRIIEGGSLPLWDPYTACGFPLLGSLEPACFYPFNFLFLYLPPLLAYIFLIYIHYSLAGIFTFLYLRELKISWTAALFSGITFMFSSFLITHLGHTTYHNASIWLPLIVFCLEKIRQNFSFNFFILGSFAFAFQILSGGIQVCFYTAIVVILYSLFFWKYNQEQFWIKKRFMWLTITISILLLGILLSAIQILPTLELLERTTRSKISYNYFSNYPLEPEMLLLFFFPYLFGALFPGFYPIAYWGRSSTTEACGYTGILPLCFATIAFLSLRKKDLNVKFWTFMGILAIILAMGRIFSFLNYITYGLPIYNLFRAPGRWLLVYNFAIAVLSGIGLNFLISYSQEHLSKIKHTIKLFSKTLALLILAVCGFIITCQVLLIKSPFWQRYSKNFSFKNPAIYIPLIIILLSIGVLNFLKKKKDRRFIAYIILILIFFDLYFFGHFFNQREYFVENLIKPEKFRPTVKYILESEKDSKIPNYRIVSEGFIQTKEGLDLIYPNTNVMYPICSVNTFNALILKEYRDLLKMHEVEFFIPRFKPLFINNKILSLLNVKYIIKTLFCSREIRLTSVQRISKFIHLKPHSDYQVDIFVRKEGLPTDDLIVGVCGSYFGNPQIKFIIRPKDLELESKEFSFRFNSRDILGGETYLKIFTSSTVPIIIDRIQLVEVGETRENLLFEKIDPEEIVRNGSPLYHKKYEDGLVTVIENKNVLPRAYMVSKVRPVVDFQQANSILWDEVDSFDPHKEALVETEELPFVLGEDKGVVCKIIDYQPNQIIIQSDSSENSFLVLADTYYPGWMAYIDGIETKVYRTNGILRGVFIPKGEHTIKFIYRPKSFKYGVTISIITFFILMGTFLSYQIKQKRR